MAGQSKRIILKTIALLFLFAFPASATIIRVPQDQPTIQVGINVAISGDTVVVGSGTYMENLNFYGKNILLRSSAGSEFTVIKPASTGIPILQIVSGEDTTAMIEGFTFSNGVADYGSAIHFLNSSGTVMNCIFVDNKSTNRGEQVGCRGASHVRILENTFKATLPSIGAIYCEGSFVEISRNLILNTNSSAVVFIFQGSTASITNNTFVNNVGGALSVQDRSGADIRNNIFVNNDSYGIYNGAASESTTVQIDYNDFINSPLFRAALGTGNLATDPLFRGGSPFNYRLQPASLCIDAGDPFTPVPPGGGSRVDMGVFEFFKPGEFSLLFPANNSALFSKQPTFYWGKLHGTSQSIEADYKLFLSFNSSFIPADTSPVVSDTFWQVSFPLDFHKTYFWKVMAVTDSADTIFSQEVRSFNITDSPPGSFSLVSPANTSNIVIKTPLFDWGNAIDPDPVDTVKYTFIISSDSGFLFAYSQSSLSGSSFIVPNGVLNRGLRYFWKVKASDTQDSSKFSNEIFRFRLLHLGDLNGDGILSPTDIVLLLNHVFLAAPVDPPEVADMNCDGNPSPADVVLGLNAVFLGQPPPCDP